MQTVFVYGTLRAGEVNDIRHAAARHEIAAPNLLERSLKAKASLDAAKP